MKPAALVAVLLGSCLALALWLSTRDDAALAAPAPEIDGTPPAKPASVDLTASPVPVAAPEIPAPSRSTVESSSSVPAAPPVRLEGTVQVSDSSGRVHDAESGELVLVEARRDRGRPATFDVPVSAGRWSVELPAGSRVRVRELELGGLPALLEDTSPATFRTPTDEPVALSARWLETVHLRVVARASGLDLGGVVLARGWSSSGDRDGHDHPGLDPQILLDGVHSPLELPTDAKSVGSVDYHVRAPGFAWARVSVDPLRPRPVRVELVPGGDLEVHLTGRLKIADLYLRLGASPFSSQTSPDLTVPVKGRDRIELAGLVPEGYQLTARVGQGGRERLAAVADRLVDVTAGGLTRVELFVPPEAEPRSVALSGTLEVPAAWELERPPLELSFEGNARSGFRSRLYSSDLDLRPIDAVTWQWTAGEVLPGTWIARLPRTGYERALEVPPEGLVGERLAVPPPAVAVIVGVDERSGEPVELDSVRWRTVGGREDAWILARGGVRVELRVPAGEIDLAASGEVAGEPLRIALEAGQRREVRLSVERTCSFVLELFAGNERLPFEQPSRLRVEPLGHGGELRGFARRSREEVRFQVSSPGLYLVHLPPIESYLPVEPIELNLRSTEPLVRRVDLGGED